MTVLTFEELKTKYENKLVQEAEVTCNVLAKLKDGLLVNIDNEWEGFIPNSHLIFDSSSREASIQDSFKALIISGPDRSDRYVVSPKALKEKFVWEKLQVLKEENTPLRVTISKVIKGGAEVYIEGVRAFLPGRYIRLPGMSQDNWTNQEIDVLIEELDYKEKKLILNQKKAVDLDKQKKAALAIQKLNEGDIVEAPILRVADFGVFVDLGGLDGLIPASELSWGRFNHPRDIVKIGQVLQARIFRIERENQRVALSVKQLLGDPWEHIDSEIEIGCLVQGKITSEAPFGLFVELKPGVEALLHNTEIPEGIEKPPIGSLITVKVLKMDIGGRKIGLSLRDVVQKKEEIDQKLEQSTSDEKQQDTSYDDLSPSLPQVSLEDLNLTTTENEAGKEEVN